MKEVGKVHGPATVESANNSPQWRVNKERKARQERKEEKKEGLMPRGFCLSQLHLWDPARSFLSVAEPSFSSFSRRPQAEGGAINVL